MKRDSEKDRHPISDDIRTKVSEKLMDASEDGRISCARAQGLAKALGVSYAVVGQVADELRIRIKECQLGCF